MQSHTIRVVSNDGIYELLTFVGKVFEYHSAQEDNF